MEAARVSTPSSPRTPARHSTADELTLTESDSDSDYLKLQAENIKEKFFRELAIPNAAAANKKPGAKRPRKTTTTTVPCKSARIAAKSSSRDDGGHLVREGHCLKHCIKLRGCCG